MRWLRLVAMLPLIGVLVGLVGLGHLLRPLDRSTPAPAVGVDRDGVVVQAGNLGEPRHVRQQVVMVLVVAVAALGMATSDLAAAGVGGPMLVASIVVTGLFAVGVPGCTRWLRFEQPKGTAR